MRPRTVFLPVVILFFLVPLAGCVSSGGSGGGWVATGHPEAPPPTERKAPPPDNRERDRGLERAARNHMRSAYRFLEKGKPDHAMKELEKARSKMGRDFWFHYYLGGAYYLKGMHREAQESWEMAFRFTADHRLRSRARTCQSFVVFTLQDEGASVGFLKNAVDLDRENGKARELLDDLRTGQEGQKDQRVGFLKNQNGPPPSGKGREKDDRKGKGGEKAGKGKGKKIQEQEQFRSYFFVEMP